MGTPFYGEDCFLGVGLESTYGTAVARAYYYRVEKQGLAHDWPVNFNPSLDGEGSVFKRRPYRGKKNPGGPVTLRCQFEGLEHWLANLFGGIALDTAVTGVGKWTFTVDRDLPTGMTVSLNADPASGDVKLLHEGCKIAKGAFKFPAGEIAQAVFDLVAEDREYSATADTFSAYTDSPIVECTTVHSLDGANENCAINDLGFNFINALKDGRYPPGANTRCEPLRGGLMAANVEFDLVWGAATEDYITKFDADTALTLTTTLTGGEISGSSPATDYKLEIALPSLLITPTADPPFENAGIMSQKFTAEVYDNGSDEPITVTLWNSNQTNPY